MILWDTYERLAWSVWGRGDQHEGAFGEEGVDGMGRRDVPQAGQRKAGSRAEPQHDGLLGRFAFREDLMP